MAVAEIKVVPVGTDSTSYSDLVTACCQAVSRMPGIKLQVTPTSTIIQGQLDQVFDAARRIHEAAFQNGVQRALTTISIDERRDKEMNIEEMVESVTAPLF